MSTTAPLPRPIAQPSGDEDGIHSLVNRLAAADRSLQKERSGAAMLRSWPWIVGSVIVAFAIDVAAHLDAPIRVAVSGLYALLALGGIALGAWIAFRRRNSLEHTARVLEGRHSRLGSKLINLLQLRAQASDPTLSALTRQLAANAVESYAQALRDEPIEQLARTDKLRLEAKRAAYGLLGSAVIFALFFDISRTEIPRFLDPFGDHPAYSFTQLEISDPPADGARVEYGKSQIFTAKAFGHRPDELFLSFHPPGHPEKTVTVPMFDKGEHGFTQRIEGIHSDLIVTAHTKNRHAISRQRKISVILTPRLEGAFVKIAPPAYTGLASVEQPFLFKNLKALEGSKITFRLQSNRPLGSGQLGVDAGKGAIENVTLTPSAEREVSGIMEARQPAALKFSLIDRDGFVSEQTWESALTVTHDLPPDVQISDPNSDSFVAMDFTARPVVEASDDYGLKTLRIHTGHNGVFEAPRVITYEKPSLHAREALKFDVQQMGCKPGDTFTIFAEAIDNAPEPHLTRSKTVTLTVISASDYNNFVREQVDMEDVEAKYSNLLNELRDMVEQQKKIGEQAEALQKELADAKSDAEKAEIQKKLDDLVNQQHALNEKLNDLASKMENFVRKEPLYDVESDLKDTLAQKAKEVRASTAANQDAMNQLGYLPPQSSPGQPDPSQSQNEKGSQPSQEKSQKQEGSQGEGEKGERKGKGPSPSGQQAPSQKTLTGFKQASDGQAARLGQTEQSAEEGIEKPLQDMSLMQQIVNDINQYKDLYSEQKELASQAKAYARQGPLSREDQLALKDLAAKQKQIGDDLDAVEQKMWEDGKAAKDTFPKAGSSAQHIAEQMGDLRLQTLANRATEEMLAGNGATGAQLSENIRKEMEKLFTQCNANGQSMSSELDQYMSVQRSMKPGNNFRQMMQSHRFGSGMRSGTGSSGNGGRDGQAIITGANANVLGGESKLTDDVRSRSSGGSGAKHSAASEVKESPALDKPDVRDGLNPVNRESEAVRGESGIDQYSDIVDHYFKALTKEPAKELKKP